MSASGIASCFASAAAVRVAISHTVQVACCAVGAASEGSGEQRGFLFS